LGVNRVEPCEPTLDLTAVQPDGFLLAGRYTLLDHERALQRLMPDASAKNVDIVVGGPYSSGVLAGGTHFEYQKAPRRSLARSSASRPSPAATRSPSRPPRSSSRSPIPPRLPSSRAPADPSGSPKTMPR
jgi:hypothetical protein